ncbi:MAG: hypothetical protein Tsb002_27970 [Wenzhouxiangellaceae bacterium]
MAAGHGWTSRLQIPDMDSETVSPPRAGLAAAAARPVHCKVSSEGN